MGRRIFAVTAAAVAVVVLCSAAHSTAYLQRPPRATFDRYRFSSSEKLSPLLSKCELPLNPLLSPRLRPTSQWHHTTTLFSSKWDNLVDDEEEEEGEGRTPLPGPRDMLYTPQHILRQNDRFVAIRDAGGPELTNDVYGRDPATDVFWFVGKVARVTDVSTELAVARQWNLIEEHASRLRPLELFPVRGSMELWAAPGDSELDVAYNRPHIQFFKLARTDDVEGAMKVRAVEVGFQGEIYDAGEEGFRTWRTDDGFPKKDEVVGAQGEMEKGPKRAPTDAEMKDIQEILKGKDLNEFFEDQK